MSQAAKHARLTVAMIVRDAEDLLRDSLESIQSIADEIVSADTGSAYKTMDVAKTFGAKAVERQWQGLVDATGLAEPFAAIERVLGLDFRREGDRYQARKTIAGLVESWCERRPYAEVAAALEATGACFGPYRTLREALDVDPRLSESNPVFSRVAHPDIGTHLTPGSPMHFSK